MCCDYHNESVFTHLSSLVGPSVFSVVVTDQRQASGRGTASDCSVENPVCVKIVCAPLHGSFSDAAIHGVWEDACLGRCITQDGSTRQMTSSSLMLAVCVCLTIGKVVMRPSAQTTINNENSRVAPDASTESVRNVRCHPNSDQTLQVKRDGSLIMPHSLPDGKGMGGRVVWIVAAHSTEHTTYELRFPSEMVLDFLQ